MNEVKRRIIARLSSIFSDKQDIILTTLIKTRKRIDLEHPSTYNEKIQWYKLNYRVPLLTQCADKVHVREYVKSYGLEHILTKQFAIYEKAQDIDFTSLPDECFIKCNHNSAGNYHYKRSDNPDESAIKKRFARMLSINQYSLSREWAYKNIQPLIICEEYLKPSAPEKFVDFNFFCFNGQPKLVMYNLGLCAENGDHADGKRAIFDEYFQPVDMTTNVEVLPYSQVSKPEQFEQMLEYAKILSKPFPHVRVDFFLVDNEIHFGELTFYSGGGFGKFYPEKWQKIMGDWFILPETMK